MTTAFVSGCFDPLHAGHLKFFKMASDGGRRNLIVCIPSDRVIRKLKGRSPTVPCRHRQMMIEELGCVSATVIGDDMPPVRNFVNALRVYHQACHISVLVVTTDDREADFKNSLCEELGIRYEILDKTPPFPGTPEVSSTTVRRLAAVPAEVPLRVDFAGGWLDVPKLARSDGYIVNCTITPKVSLDHWPYEKRSGLGGSAAWALLQGRDPLQSELDAGVGWQDPAVIQETGLCCWRSGTRPELVWKRDPSELAGRLALWWTGAPHDTADLVDDPRGYEEIATAGVLARHGAIEYAIRASYQAQLDEGMNPLPKSGIARKYCGSGWGGYAVYLFSCRRNRDLFVDVRPENIVVEPYIKEW